MLLRVVVGALLCVATTCDSPLRFDVSGDLQSGVVFRVFDAQNQESQVQADHVVVGELAGEEIWRLAGQASVRELVYGKPLDGMIAVHGPQPLEQGKDYYIVVEGGDRWRGGYYGSAAFAVGEDGRVGPAPLERDVLDNREE